MCFDFLYNLRPKHFSLYKVLSEKSPLSQVYAGHHVKFAFLLRDFNDI